MSPSRFPQLLREGVTMTRDEFERELESIQADVREAYDLVRAFPRPESVTFAAKCVLLEKSEKILRRVKMLMIVSERTVSMSIQNRGNAPFYPPSIDIHNSLLNFDNER